ncbi:hypothetical protein PtA15_6A603 [Puccinia triticina]|uniref:Tet-like 2OG-Fe(II) oxygenase domain-containing protein n=1 Tax=Puccinia triticina TaxID=208348 RepID=A0ABY7CL70_9BASI|nr:uncharacterized protein PtA15_6A603 [Puccinia triticina]WAQ85973.1 hypothetical protein PtA15_6A603 [Puccinia triticina]WAR55869.1 hypothetical protein PtB15_6B613 [Puccinia triticina]
MVKAKIHGQYIKQAAVNADPEIYNKVFSASTWVATILGNMFKKMGSIPFKNNVKIMQKNGIPNFADLGFTDSTTKLAGSPHILYMDSFYN